MVTHAKEATVNGIDMNTLKQTVAAVQNDPELGKSHFRVSNRWVEGNHNRTTVKDFYSAGRENQHRKEYKLDADEPALLAGNDRAPNPVEHLLNALASCLTTSMVAHAAVRGIHIEELSSEIEGDIDLSGFLGLNNDVPKGYTNIRVRFRVKSDEKDLDKLTSLAHFSPVFNTITQGANVDVQVVSA